MAKLKITSRQVARARTSQLPRLNPAAAGLSESAVQDASAVLSRDLLAFTNDLHEAEAINTVTSRMTAAQAAYSDISSERFAVQGGHETLVDDSIRTLDEIKKRTFEGITDGRTAEMLSQRFAVMERSAKSRARTTAMTQRIQHNQALVDQTLDQSQELIRRANSSSEAQMISGDVRALLDAQVAKGLLSETAAQQKFTAFQTQAQTDYVQRLIREQPGQAVALLDSKEAMPGIDEGRRNTLLREARAEVRRIERELQVQQDQEDALAAVAHARQASDLEIAVKTGGAGEGLIEQAFDEGIITAAKRTELRLTVEKRREKDTEQAAEMARVSTSIAAGIPLDASNTQDQAAVDLYFETQFAPGVDVPSLFGLLNPLNNNAAELAQGEQIATELTGFVAQTRVIPSQVRGMIRTLSRSGDPAHGMIAADLVGRMQKAAPEVVATLPKAELAYATLTADLIAAGMTPETAAGASHKRIFATNEAEQAERRSRFKAFKPDQVKALENRIDDDFDSLFKSQPDAPVALQAEFNQLSQTYFGLTDDVEVARELAWSDLTRVWGVTALNGERQLMKYAPETVYGQGRDTDWMQTQLSADVKALGVTDAVRLVADDRTARETQPSWALMRIRADGLPEPILDDQNRPARWRPDFASSAAGKQAAREREQAVKAARQRAEAEREMRALSAQVPRGGRGVIQLFPAGEDVR